MSWRLSDTVRSQLQCASSSQHRGQKQNSVKLLFPAQFWMSSLYLCISADLSLNLLPFGRCPCFSEKTESAVSVCGPASALLQHPEQRRMALSGASLHSAYHSITGHAAWLKPMCKTSVEKASWFSLIECPLRNVFPTPHFYQKHRTTRPRLSCKIGSPPSMTWWSSSGLR